MPASRAGRRLTRTQAHPIRLQIPRIVAEAPRREPVKSTAPQLALARHGLELDGTARTPLTRWVGPVARTLSSRARLRQRRRPGGREAASPRRPEWDAPAAHEPPGQR